MAVSAKATQSFVPIKEVRDGIVVLKGGEIRAILLASSVNLALKSSDEQMAIISQFQTFLNSLDFPIQIVIQSRRLDIRPYLTLLEGREKEVLEPLLKLQITEYMRYIRLLTESVDIMTKRFYVVVPYSAGAPTASIRGGFFSTIFGGKKEYKNKAAQDAATFEEQRTQLDERVSVVSSGLGRIGVKIEQLDTEAVIELFYKTFNPGDIQQSVHFEETTEKIK